MNKIIIIFTVLLGSSTWLFAQPSIPCGHSHNDYLQKRPLFEAVELGYASIEIDICLDKNNQIKVAHNPWLLSSKKTMEEMYFDPIVKMINDKDTIFKYSIHHPLHLIIDIKTNGDTTYKQLRNVLMKYKNYITTYDSKSGKVIPQVLKISLTGNRPMELILKEDEQLVKIDIGLNTIGNNVLQFPENLSAAERFTLGQVNLNYASYLNYHGFGKYSQQQEKKILEISNIAHMNRLKLRLYATGNNKMVWKYLLDGGVDWINVDKLKKFATFYKSYLSDKNKKF